MAGKEIAAASQTEHGKNHGGHQNNQRKRGGGRKRSATKVEDEHLVKRLKMGENVERNERQIKHLEELNQGICLIDTWYPSGEL